MIEAALGGSGLVALELTKQMHDEGNNVALIYSPRRTDKSFEMGIELLRSRGITVSPLSLHPYAGVRAFLGSMGALREASASYEVMHLHGAWAGLLGRLASLMAVGCIVYSPHGGVVHPRNGLLYWLAQRGERLLSKKTDAYVMASEYEETRLRSIVGNGVRSQFIPHATTRAVLASHGVPVNRAIAFGIVGRLVAEKRVDLALDAFGVVAREVQEVTLTIVGDGPLRAVVLREVEMRGLASRVTMPGFIVDKKAIYSQFDVLVLPSDSEAFGLVAAEAQGFGIPTIATNSGGVTEVVKDRVNGLVVPRNDADKLAEAMLQMSIDTQLFTRLATQAALDASLRSAWDDVSQLYCHLYSRLLESKR